MDNNDVPVTLERCEATIELPAAVVAAAASGDRTALPRYLKARFDAAVRNVHAQMIRLYG